jgi:hypothetical protein
MKHFIEGVEVTEKHIGDPVTYMPPHTKGDASHPDAERGHISSFNDSCLFVRFKSASGANTPTRLLVWG